MPGLEEEGIVPLFDMDKEIIGRLYRDQCRYFKQYKAKKPPRCGCAACLALWDVQVMRSIATSERA